MNTNSTSPVTGIIEEHLVIIDFGKHEGRTIQEVASLDPGFYSQLVSQKDSGIYSIRRQRDKTFRLYMNPLSSPLANAPSSSMDH